MKFYISTAATNAGEATALEKELRSLGHTSVTSCWEYDPFSDTAAILDSDFFISLSPIDTKSSVEFGIALASEKPIEIIGFTGPPTTFHTLPQVTFFATVKGYIAYRLDEPC